MQKKKKRKTQLREIILSCKFPINIHFLRISLIFNTMLNAILRNLEVKDETTMGKRIKKHSLVKEQMAIAIS